MKRLSKIVIVTIGMILCCTGCMYHDAQNSAVSEVVQTTQSDINEQGDNSNHQNSRSASEISSRASQSIASGSSDEPESSLHESSEPSETVSDDESSQPSQTESSQESSKEVSKEVSQTPEKVPDESIVYEMNKKYFVKRLDDTSAMVFLQMYDAVQNFEESVTFNEIIASDLLDSLMFLLNYDCPELIQLNGDYSPIYADDSCKTVSGVGFTYNMDREEYREYTDELYVFFENLKADIGNESDVEKEKYVYDMIFNTCVYDDTEKYSGTVYGTLINHIGRCEGISKSFLWCMRELDIECMCVSGTPKWETAALYSGHSWNIVKINGRYYQLDLTIDNIRETGNEDEKTYPNYGYFNVDDTFNDETHEVYGFYREFGLPECKSDKANYHKMNGLYICADEDIQERLTEIMENYFIDGKLDHISVKFENPAGLNRANQYINDWIQEFVESQGIGTYDYDSTYDEICRTITIYAEAFEAEEQEIDD